jgi:ZIP family zinc transporter
LSKLWLFTLLGTFTGVVGTGAGGALAFAFPAREGKFGQLLDFSGGLMLAIVCFDLLPEAFSLAPLPVVLAGVAAGAGMIMLVSRLEGHMHLAHHGLRLSALSVTLGIAVHNLPEGLAVGTALSEDFRLGLALCLAIFLHDLPEGMSVGLTLRAGGARFAEATAIAALAGLTTGIGAAIGAAAGTLTPSVSSLCLAAAAGAMLELVLGQMLPEADRLLDAHAPRLFGIFGVMAGMALRVLLH